MIHFKTFRFDRRSIFEPVFDPVSEDVYLRRVPDPMHDRFTPECDRCGRTLDAECTFKAAVQAMREKGWLSVRNAQTGWEWENYCPACRRDVVRPTAAEFAGINGRMKIRR